MRYARLVIAATASGCGKTSVALALAAGLRRRGLGVLTFKAGPDFLDPVWLSLASGRPCYNLDGWMCRKQYVLDLFSRRAANCDIALIEGVMGLFDGASPDSIEGSTAELARWLDAPVLLVADARGAGRSAAAAVAGFAAFEPGVRVAGVIANHCGSARHAAWIGEALRAAGQAPLVGAVPRDGFPPLPGRHLGLAPPDGTDLDVFVDAAERFINLEAVLAIACSAPRFTPRPEGRAQQVSEPVRLGVAWDAAFHFYYPDTLEALEDAGARIVRFSPMADDWLPHGLDGLYIGGGYPEEHAATLAENRGMREAVRAFATSGRPLYAECGGLMYLAEGIETKDGGFFPMAGVLPVRSRMLPRRRALGYVEVVSEGGGCLAPAGETMRGHEFHYSEITPGSGQALGWQPAWRLRRRREEAWHPEGFQRGRVLASYVHLHLASHPGAARRFVDACREARP